MLNIELNNASEAGMPANTIENCRQLLARRIQKTFTNLPELGTEIGILYAENDPLGETGEIDDSAYVIDFIVDSSEGSGLDDATVWLSLIF